MQDLAVYIRYSPCLHRRRYIVINTRTGQLMLQTNQYRVAVAYVRSA